MTEEQNKNANNGQPAATNANPQANQPATPTGCVDPVTKVVLNVFGVVVLFALLAFIVTIFVHAGDGPANPDDPLKAQVMAQAFVKDRLRSPSSADFGYDGELLSNITKRDDGVYVVKGWVDSQNGYGAMVRTHYVVMVKYAGGAKENWQLVGEPMLFQ